MSAIYSGPFLEFPPATSSRTFRSLDGIDRVTRNRAIDAIWFPRACECENPLRQKLIRKPGKKHYIPTSNIRDLTSDIRRSTLPCEAFAHRNHPGRTGGFSP